MPRTPDECTCVFCPPPEVSETGTNLYRRNPVFLRFTSALVYLLLLFTFYQAFVINASAQSTRATLSGIVIDQAGAVIPGVNIDVISVTQGFERATNTNNEGVFVVTSPLPGNYTIKAEHEGFNPAEVRNVILNVNDPRMIKISLKIGELQSTTVDVVDTPSLIDESSAVGTTVNRQFVEHLPLNGRSVQPSISLSPGVVLTKASNVEAGQFSVNGQRANANYFTIDGVSANIGASVGLDPYQAATGALPGFSASGGTNNLVSVDALQEFKIQTSSYAAEFGRTPGAQVQLLTRSGTNDFHGRAFEYEAFDANEWFVNRRGDPRPPLRQNIFGGVGGSVLLPRFGEGGDPGTHQIKLGVDYRRLSPIFSVRGYFQAVNFFSGPNQVLTEILSNIQVSAQDATTTILTNLSTYVQDLWNVNQRLSLIYGMRYEVNSAPSGKNGNDPVAITDANNLANLAFSPPVTSVYETTYNNFAPRIGIAYQLSQRSDRETILRGGFGVLYDLGGGAVINALSARHTFTASKTLTGITFPLLSAADARPPAVPAALPVNRLFALDLELKPPYTYQWNVAAEQSFGGNQTFSVTYAALSRRLPLQILTSYTWARSIDTVFNDSSIMLTPVGQIDPQRDLGPLLTWWGLIASLYIAAFAVLQLEKHWYRTAQVFFTLATFFTLGSLVIWVWNNPDGLCGGIAFTVGVCALVATIWFVRKVEADINQAQYAKASPANAADYRRNLIETWRSMIVLAERKYMGGKEPPGTSFSEIFQRQPAFVRLVPLLSTEAIDALDADVREELSRTERQRPVALRLLLAKEISRIEKELEVSQNF
jgi:hypothetical protein